MPDFSTISQSPDIRAIVQENTLERAFHDSLYPRLMFRGEAEPIIFPANIGDSLVFTGIGLIKPKMRPLAPNTDPAPSDYQKEQWDIQLQTYADTIDTPMPTSIAAIANLFLRNAQQLGLGAGQTLNRLVRNKMYNAALSGHTVADGAQGPTVTLRVKRLNGFTKARQTTGNAVRFTVVSAANPLPILIFDDPGAGRSERHRLLARHGGGRDRTRDGHARRRGDGPRPRLRHRGRPHVPRARRRRLQGR